MQPPTASLCLQLLSALQQPFPGISNSGFGLSPVPGEIRPLRFTTKQHFGFPPSSLLHHPAVALAAAQPQLCFGKGRSSSSLQSPKGNFLVQ